VKRVIVWGTGNVGQPALRAVIAHAGLKLVGVVVSNPAKEGKDAGELAGLDVRTGVTATRDWKGLLAAGCDAVVYTASSEMRFGEAWEDVLACLSAGANVVTGSIYPLLYKPQAPADWLAAIDKAAAPSGASIMVSGVDPGWAMEALPLFISGVSAGITEIRTQEIMNYAHYDAPDVVRNIIGFGKSMDELPMMLQEFSLNLVWAPMVRALGDALDKPVDEVTTHVERRPLEHDIDVPGMGRFEAGTQGAFRFQVKGHHKGKPLFVVEHVTRIDNACAPDWPYPSHGEGVHRTLITGSPDIEVTVHAHDRHSPGPAAGGNAIAACRLVNAIPYLCDAAPPGLVESWTVPASFTGAQVRG
jgi:hypothetical protein